MRKKRLSNKKNKSYIARCAQLALLLEVSANPKPGNVDREHDYKDTSYFHFLASAVGVYPILEKACFKEKGLGSFILECVRESSKWHGGGNTHFGAFLLLIPLVMAGGSKKLAEKIVKKTSVEDAINLYKAFSEGKVRVSKVEDLERSELARLDVTKKSSISELKSSKITLYKLMKISADYDLIAYELVNGFPKTFECANKIMALSKKYSINDAIVLAFLELLAKYPDTFIQAKFNKEKALLVSRKAKELIKNKELDWTELKKFDEELIKEKINPGSTADIIIAGLFIALLNSQPSDLIGLT